MSQCKIVAPVGLLAVALLTFAPSIFAQCKSTIQEDDKIGDIKGALACWKDTHSRVLARLDRLTADLATANKNVSREQIGLTALKGSYGSLQATFEQQKQRLGQLESELVALQGTHRSLQAAFDQQKQRVVQLEGEASAMRQSRASDVQTPPSIDRTDISAFPSDSACKSAGLRAFRDLSIAPGGAQGDSFASGTVGSYKIQFSCFPREVSIVAAGPNYSRARELGEGVAKKMNDLR